MASATSEFPCAELPLADLEPFADNDAEPKGDGTPGDGFTAFEEYRGFMKQVGRVCSSPLKVRHARTNPRIKDLFIHASDPLLQEIAEDFGMVTGSDVDKELWTHTICPAQYVDDQTRIVNFTMRSLAGPSGIGEGIRGAKLTQDRPQHGLYLANQPPGNGLLGRSFGFGPPGNVSRVAVDIPAIRAIYAAQRFQEHLTLIVTHELGHAVGIRHHGDRNIAGPVVVLNTPGCVVGMSEGTVGGAPACGVSGIAIRGQQNSGNASCPMKYIKWQWYVPPGWSLRNEGLVDFRPNTTWAWRRPSERVAYSVQPDSPTSLSSTTQLQRYRKDLDEPPADLELCSSSTGTGVNALPMDQNHAGQATREPACTEQLRVNDVPRNASR